MTRQKYQSNETILRLRWNDLRLKIFYYLIRDSRFPCNLELNLNHGRELKIVRPQYSITRRRVYIARCLEFPGFDFNRARGGEKKRKKKEKWWTRKSVVDRSRGENETKRNEIETKTKPKTKPKIKTKLVTTRPRGVFLDLHIQSIPYSSDNTRVDERGSISYRSS